MIQVKSFLGCFNLETGGKKSKISLASAAILTNFIQSTGIIIAGIAFLSQIITILIGILVIFVVTFKSCLELRLIFASLPNFDQDENCYTFKASKKNLIEFQVKKMIKKLLRVSVVVGVAIVISMLTAGFAYISYNCLKGIETVSCSCLTDL